MHFLFNQISAIRFGCRLLPTVLAAPFCFALLSPPSSICSTCLSRGRISKSYILAARSNSNPFITSMSNFVSVAASSLFGTSNRRLPVEVEEEISSAIPYTWEEIRSKWEMQATEKERQFRDNIPLGYGEASPLHNLRLYDASVDASSVRVTFYRDSGMMYECTTNFSIIYYILQNPRLLYECLTQTLHSILFRFVSPHRNYYRSLLVPVLPKDLDGIRTQAHPLPCGAYKYEMLRR